jgi:hypothetical protein
MPVKKGAAGRNMGPTNGTLRKEIADSIISGLKVTDVSRTKDSIVKSANFHLDSKLLNGQYKVEIQYLKGSKQTVAVVQMAAGASDNDLRTGLTNSLKDQCTWLIT